MRLDKEEQKALENAIKDVSGEVYLFGSRVDDNKQGGDIDLLIISATMGKHEKRHIRRMFFDQFGEQKMDIILDDGHLEDPFVKMVYQKAKEL